jgi:hypothetical protein
MGIFDKRSSGEKLRAKQAKLSDKVEKEFSKAKEMLAMAGVEGDEVIFALRSHTASLGAVTRAVWMIESDRIVKMSGIPPAYSREYFPLKEVESVSVSNELIPTVAIRHKGRYVTFKADAISAQYFCGLASESIEANRTES